MMDYLYPYTGALDSESTEYLLEHSAEATSISELQNIRFGGLFHNSNQCMKYISLCSVIFVVENYRRPIKTHLPFWFMVFSSTLLSGSRTGLVIVFSAILMMVFIRRNTRVSLRSVAIYAIVISSILWAISVAFSGEFRMFDIKEGTSDGGSIMLKYDNLKYYLGLITEIRQILVGNFDVESIKAVYHTPFSQFDSEWGNAVYFYGFFFLIIYFAFLIRTFSKLKGINIIALLLFFWIISSTILFSYRTSFAFFLILSRCYYNSQLRVYDKSYH